VSNAPPPERSAIGGSLRSNPHTSAGPPVLLEGGLAERTVVMAIAAMTRAVPAFPATNWLVWGLDSLSQSLGVWPIDDV
jgi:hypothetical protein